ncbi:MAG: alpha/beta hydrolase [Duganella sp.]
MKTIYLLCGLLCDEEVWAAQAAQLSRDYDVRVMKFTGQDSMRAMAEHVLADAPARFALAGHSMGGRVALEVVRLAPQRIERLALLDTGYEAAQPGEDERRGLLVERARADGIAAIARDWALPMLAPAHRFDGALVAAVLAMVGRMTPQIYAAQTRALLSRPDAADVLARIDCPALVLCGRQDGWSPPERHERMAALMARPPVLRLVEQCGHMSMMEQPAAVLRALRDWLEMP